MVILRLNFLMAAVLLVMNTRTVVAQSLKEDVLTQGNQIGKVYEAFLSPHQEPGEEKDTPKSVPKVFQSTKPSELRSERDSRGYGRISFSNDLSKVYIEVKVEGVRLDQINMFHIHCGLPDQLGPILVDFAQVTEIQTNFRDDGLFAVEVDNSHILATIAAGQGLVGEFTSGCPIVPGLPAKVQTVAGMEYIAQKGELYFNLHTEGQTYFGDIRGRVQPATSESAAQSRALLQEGLPPAPSPSGKHDH
ncbi:MAG: CHRD domain-containing protein [Bacteroidia bacterium]|nr:CHRD domain-containing protein [Bacteroidia bacterium]